MTSRTILLDGVDSQFALVLTTDLFSSLEYAPALHVGYETEAFEHVAPPRILRAGVLTLNLGHNRYAENVTKDAYEWLSAKLADKEELKKLVTYLSDFIEEHDNGCGWHITRLRLYGPTVNGNGLTQVLKRPLAKYDADDEDYGFEHVYLK
jgi:hypothetical protein